MSSHMPDMKSVAARRDLGVCWYEFPICPSDREFLSTYYKEITRLDNDASAGLLRYYVTQFIQEHGKISPELTDWLLERIPIAPTCWLVRDFEASEVVLRYQAPSVISNFSVDKEREFSLLVVCISGLKFGSNDRMELARSRGNRCRSEDVSWRCTPEREFRLRVGHPSLSPPVPSISAHTRAREHAIAASISARNSSSVYRSNK